MLLEKNNLFWRKNIKKFIVNKKTILKKIGSKAKYQGIAVLVNKLPKLNFQNFLNLPIKKNNNEIILLIDKFDDIYNLGSILRTSYIFEISSIPFKLNISLQSRILLKIFTTMSSLLCPKITGIKCLSN